jgi:diketogulonate reductase-like aldo/keto reductase
MSRNNKIMPQICIGTVNQVGNNYDKYVSNLKGAIDIGYNHIDCADCYGIPYHIMKDILKYGIDKYGRDNFWITWKSDNINLEHIEELLRKLELDYFDLFLIHHDKICDYMALETLAVIKSTTSYIKNIGSSNCENIEEITENNSRLKQTFGFGIYAIEIQSRPIGSKINNRTILNKDFYDICEENNIKLLLFSPISAFLNNVYKLLETNFEKYERISSNLDNIIEKIIEYYTINYIKNKQNTLIIGLGREGNGCKKSFATITKTLLTNNRNNELLRNTTVKNLLNNIGLDYM